MSILRVYASDAPPLTIYKAHVYHEEVMPLIALAHKKFLASTKEMALNSAHGLAFHRGLGTPLYPSSSTPYTKYLDADTIEEFASAAYAKGNFAIVANGAEHSDLSKWVGEFFTDVPSSGAQSLQSPQTKYYGGEERIAHGSGNTMVLAFPGSSSYTGGFYKPEIAVLAALLGGESSIKWSSGFSLLSKAASKNPGVSVKTKSAIYSDAGLLYVMIHGSAKQVAGTAQEVVKMIKSIAGGEISKEDIMKARALAKFKELEHGQTIMGSLELTGAGLVQGGKPYQLDETAKAIDGVTEDQVKKVSQASTLITIGTVANITSTRPPSRYLTTGRRFRRWVICSSYLLRRSLVSRCKYEGERERSHCTNSPVMCRSRVVTVAMQSIFYANIGCMPAKTCFPKTVKGNRSN